MESGRRDRKVNAGWKVVEMAMESATGESGTSAGRGVVRGGLREERGESG